MEQDNFNFHIMPDKTRFYHTNLKDLINSLEDRDKQELQKHNTKLSKISKRNIKISWGVYSRVHQGLEEDLNLSNLLTHIDAGNRESLDLIEADMIKSGYLTYYGHNLNDKSRACVYSILLKYISILNQKAIKLYKHP